MSSSSLNQEKQDSLKYVGDRVLQLLNDLDRGMTSSEYVNLYTNIYNFCLTSNSDNFSASSGSAKMGARIVGEELYQSFLNLTGSYLETVARELEALPLDSIMTIYCKKWRQYVTSCKIIDHLYRYLNNHWIKRQRDEGLFTIFYIKDAMMVEWRKVLFDRTKTKLVRASLDLIKAHRDGENVPSDHIKAFVESCNCISIYEGSSDCRATLEVYRSEFECLLLKETQTFYEQECKPYLDSHGIIEFMKKIESRLKEEESRIESYLHHSSRNALITLCEKLMIQGFFASYEKEFSPLLSQNRKEDLQRLYRLLSRVADSLSGISLSFEKYVVESGTNSLSSLTSSSSNATGNDDGEDEKKDDKIDPKSYVDCLFQTYKQFHDLIIDCFSGDSGFETALDKAFRELSNRNSVCNTSSKSPELMAKFADSVLKKGSKDDSALDIEESLNNLMVVFRYIEDKDVFQKFYTNSLAKRLVNGISASEDSEASMINKLKEMCGVDYTSKLSRMFTDVGVCREMNEQFKHHLTNIKFDLNVDFYVMVLVSNSWPFHSSNVACNIPSELEPCIDKFTRFYHSKHNGRKLNWLYHLSRGEVKARFSADAKAVYHFQVSTYQMAILLLFNNGDKYSLREICKLTNLQVDQLQGILGILCKARVLIKGDVDGDGDGNASDSVSYQINQDFKSKKLRMNLNVAIRSEQKNESQETHKTVEADRQMLIQAAIVRIMKTRKTLKHVQLVTEVIEQLQSRFKPSVPSIKKQIDTLIDKDYLARSEESRDLLNYVA